ncbi:MAG: pilin [Gammaproteobacteria bacterium]
MKHLANLKLFLLDIILLFSACMALAVAAMPALDTMAIRDKVAKGMTILPELKHQVSNLMLNNHHTANATLLTSRLDQAINTIDTPYIEDVKILNNGVLHLTFDTQTTGLLVGENSLMLVPHVNSQNQIVKWDCTGGSLHDIYRPESCR